SQYPRDALVRDRAAGGQRPREVVGARGGVQDPLRSPVDRPPHRQRQIDHIGLRSAPATSSRSTKTLLFVSTAQKSLRFPSYIIPRDTFRPFFPLGSSPTILSVTQRSPAQS